MTKSLKIFNICRLQEKGNVMNFFNQFWLTQRKDFRYCFMKLKNITANNIWFKM